MNTQPAPRRISPLTLAMMLSMLAAALLFTLWPEIDLAVSGFFYRQEIRDFVGNHSTAVLTMYKIIPIVSRFVMALIAVLFVASLFIRNRQGRNWRIRAGFLAAALMLGPGLVIDATLKSVWGRARPDHVAEFGGAARFTPAFLPTDQCDKNCSFVSGHASAGFFFAALGFLGGAATRWRWTLAALALGGIAGLGRISEGGHFLSDVVFAFYITWFSAWLVWIVFKRLGWLPVPAP